MLGLKGFYYSDDKIEMAFTFVSLVIIFSVLMLLIYYIVSGRRDGINESANKFIRNYTTASLIASCAETFVFFVIDVKLNDDGEGLYSLLMLPYLLGAGAVALAFCYALIHALRKNESSALLIGLATVLAVAGAMPLFSFIQGKAVFGILMAGARLVSYGAQIFYILDRPKITSGYSDNSKGVYFNPFNKDNDKGE